MGVAKTTVFRDTEDNAEEDEDDASNDPGRGRLRPGEWHVVVDRDGGEFRAVLDARAVLVGEVDSCLEDVVVVVLLVGEWSRHCLGCLAGDTGGWGRVRQAFQISLRMMRS